MGNPDVEKLAYYRWSFPAQLSRFQIIYPTPIRVAWELDGSQTTNYCTVQLISNIFTQPDDHKKAVDFLDAQREKLEFGKYKYTIIGGYKLVFSKLRNKHGDIIVVSYDK